MIDPGAGVWQPSDRTLAVFSVTSSCATLTTVGEQAWDWSQHVVDHVEVHAGDFDASVRFYATVLAPLGIPSWSEDSESERVMCFTRVNIVDRQPPTTGLHLCFVAASREQVDAFHRAGVEAGFRSNGAPGYRPYAPGYYAAFLLDPDDNNIEALYRESVIRDTCRRGTVPRGSGDCDADVPEPKNGKARQRHALW